VAGVPISAMCRLDSRGCAAGVEMAGACEEDADDCEDRARNGGVSPPQLVEALEADAAPAVSTPCCSFTGKVAPLLPCHSGTCGVGALASMSACDPGAPRGPCWMLQKDPGSCAGIVTLEDTLQGGRAVGGGLGGEMVRAACAADGFGVSLDCGIEGVHAPPELCWLGIAGDPTVDINLIGAVAVASFCARLSAFAECWCSGTSVALLADGTAGLCGDKLRLWCWPAHCKWSG
jgi:hypothetical protein